MMKQLQGMPVESIEITIAIKTEVVLEKILKKINAGSGLNLTKEHISFGFDDDITRAYLHVHDSEFTEEEWNACIYNMNEWYMTFDQILLEILNVPPEKHNTVYHSMRHDDETLIYITFKGCDHLQILDLLKD